MGATPEPVTPETAETPAPPAPAAALEAVTHDNLVEALAAAQAEFPAIPKRHTAEVRGKDGKPGYSYSYADLGDVLAATRPILARHGIALIQRTRYSETNGRLMLITELKHGPSGQVESSELELAQSPGAHQAFGGALTYLRRYEAVTLLGVAAEQDLDGADVEPVRPTRNGDTLAPELPDWAKPAGGDKRLELIEVLERVIGRERAVLFADNVAKTYGYLPLAVAVAVRSVGRAAIDELDPLAFDDAEARRTAAKTAAAQDAAAEAPDPPAPEPAGDEPSAEEVAEARALAEAEAAGINTDDLEPEPEPEEKPPPAPPRAAAAAPASIPIPDDLPGDPARQVTFLRGLGCICESPITVDPNQRHAACPLIGHGIGF